MTAGIAHALGDALVVIDTDLQDPPEVIPELVEGWRSGYDVVYGQRSERAGESWLKKKTANWFYRLVKRIGPVAIPENTGDFRLISRRAAQALMQIPERHRFMKGLYAWIGFRQKAVLYKRHAASPERPSGTTGSSGIWRSRASPRSRSFRSSWRPTWASRWPCSPSASACSSSEKRSSSARTCAAIRP